MEERFYYCESCGNLAFMALASGITPYCCNIEMTKLKANTVDASKEKHVPVVEFLSDKEIKVRIGSESHPMTDKHGIRFICLETDKGGIIRYLCNDHAPEVCIRFNGKPIAVYAYCNLHGLWGTKLDCDTKCTCTQHQG